MSTAEKPLKPALPNLRAVHYLLTQERGKHVAHCLDFDLVCVGGSMPEAMGKLNDLVKAHVGLSLLSGQTENLMQAPASYWRQYFEGQPVPGGAASLHIAIPHDVQFDPPIPEDELHARAQQAVPLDSPELGILARELVHAAQ